jgi:hypothetical protein
MIKQRTPDKNDPPHSHQCVQKFKLCRHFSEWHDENGWKYWCYLTNGWIDDIHKDRGVCRSNTIGVFGDDNSMEMIE